MSLKRTRTLVFQNRGEVLFWERHGEFAVGATSNERHVRDLVDRGFVVRRFLEHSFGGDVVVLDEVVTPLMRQRKRQAGPPVLCPARLQREVGGREERAALTPSDEVAWLYREAAELLLHGVQQV